MTIGTQTRLICFSARLALVLILALWLVASLALAPSQARAEELNRQYLFGTGFIPLFGDGSGDPATSGDALFGLFLRPGPPAAVSYSGVQNQAEHSAPGLAQVAFGAQMRGRPVAAYVGLGSHVSNTTGGQVNDLPLSIGVDVGNFERFLFTGEVLIPTRSDDGEVRGRVTSNSVRINASFRF